MGTKFLASSQFFVYLIFSLVLSYVSSAQAAREYIAGAKSYAYGNTLFTKIDDMKAFVSKEYCKGDGVFIGCNLTVSHETYSSPYFYWQGYLDYSRKFIENNEVKYYPVHQQMGYYIFYDCPPQGGWQLFKYETVFVCYRETANDFDCDLCQENRPSLASPPTVGNPILPMGLIKAETETDYINSTGTLSFVRSYRSDEGKWSNNQQLAVINMVIGSGSASAVAGACVPDAGRNYCHPYVAISATNDAAIRRGGRKMRYFSSSQNFKGDVDNQDRLSQILAADGSLSGWTVKNGQNDATETYDASGRIQASRARSGMVTSYFYSDPSTPQEIAPELGLLIRVTDHFGNSMQFTYDQNSNLTHLITPAGDQIIYEYNIYKLLTSVTYPDGRKRSYLYNEAENMKSLRSPLALTGIVDENNSRYATFKYNDGMQAISTEHANGVGKYTLSDGSSQSTVIDPLGTVRKYNYSDSALGKRRFTGITQPTPNGTGSVTSRYYYDANANISSMTDFKGVVTNYVYDMARNLETSRVEAAATPMARTIKTEWHPLYRLPAKISESKRLTSFRYDDNGNLISRSVQATSDVSGAAGFNATLIGLPRTWGYSYSESGQLLTVKGPRTDVNETTTYSYDEKGNLSKVTNAANHVTSFSDYDANGWVGKITDPNGQETVLAYSPRGWLTSRTVAGETTTFTYDGVGQITAVTFPDGSQVNYIYDAAHRLTSINDGLGNNVVFTLDPMGNRVAEAVTDSAGVLTTKIQRVYTTTNFLKQQTGGLQ